MDNIEELKSIFLLVDDIIFIFKDDKIIFSNSNNIVKENKFIDILSEVEKGRKYTVIKLDNKLVKINWNFFLLRDYKILYGKKSEINFLDEIKKFFNRYFVVDVVLKSFTQVAIDIVRDFLKTFGFNFAQIIVEKGNKITENRFIDGGILQSLELIRVNEFKDSLKEIKKCVFCNDIEKLNFLIFNISPEYFKNKNVIINGFFYITLVLNNGFVIHLFIFNDKEEELDILESEKKIESFCKVYEIYSIYLKNIYAVYKAEKLKSNFIMLLNHELRTPLNSILGYAQLLSSFSSDPEIIDGLSEIQYAGKDILTKVERMILLQELKFETYIVNNQVFNIKDILEKVLKETKTSLMRKKIELKTNIKDLEINTDPNLLYHLLFSFIDNSIKFTVKGGVLIETYKNERNVFIKIKDSGIGFDSKKIEKFFKEFYQVESDIMTRNIGGLGIGLSLAYEISKRTNIKFNIQTSINVGTEVLVRIEG